MNQPMITPPMPHRIVSQIGMLSLSPGATNFPSRPMMMPAMMTPMISTVCPFDVLTRRGPRPAPRTHIPNPQSRLEGMAWRRTLGGRPERLRPRRRRSAAADPWRPAGEVGGVAQGVVEVKQHAAGLEVARLHGLAVEGQGCCTHLDLHPSGVAQAAQRDADPREVLAVVQPVADPAGPVPSRVRELVVPGVVARRGGHLVLVEALLVRPHQAA